MGLAASAALAGLSTAVAETQDKVKSCVCPALHVYDRVPATKPTNHLNVEGYA